ncbi:MAG TPA: ATP-binding protein [Petrimonas sp.]|nr:ATP-binding protein [Petrimonas sp.]
MIQRELSQLLRDMASKMPIISITGPRQSGKTTLARLTFPDYAYVNLENPDTLEAAVSDPRLFLSQFQSGVIIDEAQRYPDLFSYIQTASDEANRPGKYILTGSQNFLLLEKISQSLAGRVFVTHLLPLSIAELRASGQAIDNFETSIFQGFYPRLHDADIHPTLFYPSYIQTYVERDVRQVVNVGNLYQFQRFMRLAAGRIGQLLNYSHIANELGVDLKTVKSWFSILESSFITFVLRPHFQNFSKRILKTPKLYFYDTGLACSLLGIRNERELATHWARGALFENLVVSDLMKYHYNRAIVPPLYYWRDSTGNEVDCLIDSGLQVKSIEIKSSSTISSDFFKGLDYYGKLNAQAVPYLIYGGLTPQVRKEGKVIAWNNIVDLF